MRHDGAAACVGDADAQLALLIFSDITELALHGLLRLTERFGIAQKGPPGVGQLKRCAPHDERAAKLRFKSRDVGGERLLRDVQGVGSAGKASFPREYDEIFRRVEVHGGTSFLSFLL